MTPTGSGVMADHSAPERRGTLSHHASYLLLTVADHFFWIGWLLKR